jgi:hypothetical protein
MEDAVCSELVNMTERETRKETDIKPAGTSKIRSAGMVITEEGKDVLNALQDMVHRMVWSYTNGTSNPTGLSYFTSHYRPWQ